MHSRVSPSVLAATPRDVTLFRDAADVWRTPDAFHVGELRVDSAGRADSRTQLGLGTAATLNSGIIQGAVPTLGTGGRWAAARMGSGTANSTKRLAGNLTWVDETQPDVSGLTFADFE